MISALMLSRRQSASDRPAPYCAYCASSWNTSPADGVRVEVVVEVDGVDVVLRDRVHDRGLAELASLGDAGVVVELAAVGDRPLGVDLRRMRGRQAGDVGREVHGDPVRVEPRVELEVAPVRLGHREGQRVVAGVDALGAGEVLRPRLERGRPEGVGGRPHLDDDGVVVLGDRQVVVGDQLGLLLRRREAGADSASRCSSTDAIQMPRRSVLSACGSTGQDDAAVGASPAASARGAVQARATAAAAPPRTVRRVGCMIPPR